MFHCSASLVIDDGKSCTFYPSFLKHYCFHGVLCPLYTCSFANAANANIHLQFSNIANICKDEKDLDNHLAEMKGFP